MFDVDNANPSSIGRIQLVQPDLGFTNTDDDLSQEPLNQNSLRKKGDVLDNMQHPLWNW